VLGVSEDLFYEAIIQQKVNALSTSFSDFRPWILKIKNFELSVRTTVYIAGKYPRGKDRIEAYKTAIKQSKKWTDDLKKQQVI
jgi:hypothetical protein